MYRSPNFLFLYLPWFTGIVLMLVVLVDPFNGIPADDGVYHMSAYPLDVSADAWVEVVSIPPRFPGYGTSSDEDKSSDQRLEDYLYGEVAYPADPRNEYDAGVVVISFTVRPNGRMDDITMHREPSHGRGADALRIVRSMAEKSTRWEPGTVNGRATAQRVYVKIRYSNFRWAG